MSRPSLLYLTHRVPYPPNRGDRIRTYHILRHLAERAEIALACLADEPPAAGTRDALRELCVSVDIVPVQPRLRWMRASYSFLTGGSISEGAFRSPALNRAVSRIASERPLTAVLASSSALASTLRVPALRSVPAWVDLIDVDSQKWFDFASAHRGPKSWLYRAEGKRLRKLEIQLARETNGLFVVSEAEAELFRRFCPDAPIQAVGNGVDTDYFAPRGEPNGADCVFVGALDYHPNVDAAVWFCHAVWPLVRAARPDARFRLVGREPVAAVRALSQIPGVELIGTVPDVRPYVEQASAVVVPLRIARGVQNKLLEAMSMGKAVVTAPRPLQGLPIVPGTHCLVAETPEQWKTALLDLFEQPILRSSLGTAAWSYVQNHHRWSTCLAPLSRSLGLSQPSDLRTLSTFPAKAVACSLDEIAT